MAANQSTPSFPSIFPQPTNPHFVIGQVRALLDMATEPNVEIYRMTPERLVERLREVMAEYDATRTR